jgi:hypothetical protein
MDTREMKPGASAYVDPAEPVGPIGDEQDLGSFGYKPELKVGLESTPFGRWR